MKDKDFGVVDRQRRSGQYSQHRQAARDGEGDAEGRIGGD